MGNTLDPNEQALDVTVSETSDESLKELRASIEHINKLLKKCSNLNSMTLNEDELIAFEQRYLRIKNWLCSKKEIDKGLERIESISAELNDIEHIQQVSEQIEKVLADWNSQSIPSAENLQKSKDEWDLLERQAKKTLKSIARVRGQLKEMQEEATLSHSELSLVHENPQVIDANTIKVISSRLKYHYSEYKITTFLSALNTMQIIALCGKPGTGKTTFAKQMAKALGAKFCLVEVQNNWTDSSDILGYYNPTNGTYQSTKFLEAILVANDDYKLNKEKAALHILCLDEMNLSRVEYYFATFLSLLQSDPEERDLWLLPHDVDKEPGDKLARYKHFKLPPNIRFVGTMNMDDTAQFLTPKVIDRSIFIEFTTDDEADKNPDYNPDTLTDSYFPYSAFTRSENVDEKICGSYLKTLYPSANPRLESYVAYMWEIFQLLNGISEESNAVTVEELFAKFIDMIILGKVLPSITKQDELADKTVPTTFVHSHNRFEEGKERYQHNHPYGQNDAEWSYWE